MTIVERKDELGGQVNLILRTPRRDEFSWITRDLERQLHRQGVDVRLGTKATSELVRELAPGLWVSTGFGGHGLNTTTMAGELVASALTENDEAWRLLAPFAPRWVGGPLGRYAAQAIYWRHMTQDSLRAAWERRRPRG